MRRAPTGCKVPGCDEPHYALGYCIRHYHNFHSFGSPTGKSADLNPVNAGQHGTLHLTAKAMGRRPRFDVGSAVTSVAMGEAAVLPVPTILCDLAPDKALFCTSLETGEQAVVLTRAVGKKRR